MNRVTRERVTQLARVLLDELQRQSSVQLLRDRETVCQAIAHALFDELRRDDDRQIAVIAKIAALPDAPLPGSKNWGQMYRKMLDEEYEKEGFDIG